MRLILGGKVPATVVNAIDLPFRLRKGITDPAGQPARLFVDIAFPTISPSFSKQQIRFHIVISDQVGAIPVVDLVLHPLIIELRGELIHTIMETAIITAGDLVRDLRLYYIARGQVDIGRAGSSRIIQQVN